MEYEKRWALSNVTRYKSKAEYMADQFADVTEDEGSEAFGDQMEAGFIQEITCGTYNGASDVFTPWQPTDENIIDTILRALHEEDFYNFMAEVVEDPEELKTLTSNDWVWEYTQIYDVFIIGNEVYVNKD